MMDEFNLRLFIMALVFLSALILAMVFGIWLAGYYEGFHLLPVPVFD